MKKSLISLFFTAICTLTLGACETVEGVGQDIQKAGSAIEKEANENK